MVIYPVSSHRVHRKELLQVNRIGNAPVMSCSLSSPRKLIIMLRKYSSSGAATTPQFPDDKNRHSLFGQERSNLPCPDFVKAFVEG